MLSAGERRSFTANDIFRDPAGASATPTARCASASRTPSALGLVDGGRARITTAAGSAEATVEVSEAMQPGHVSLPNGLGLDYVDDDGDDARPGRRAERAHLDASSATRYAGTPWHKHVPARIEAVKAEVFSDCVTVAAR